jgi:hypothetical protein
MTNYTSTVATSENIAKMAEDVKKQEAQRARIAEYEKTVAARMDERKADNAEKHRSDAINTAKDVLSNAQSIRNYLGNFPGAVVHTNGREVQTSDLVCDDAHKRAYYDKGPSEFDLAKRKVYAGFASAYTKALGELATGLEALAVETITSKKS